MKKIVILGLVLLCTVVALVVFAMRLRNRGALLSSFPTHGTSFKLEWAVPESANVTKLLHDAVEVRFTKKNIPIFWETISATQARVTLPYGGSNLVSTATPLLSYAGQLEFRLIHRNSDDLVRKGSTEPGYELLRQAHLAKDQSEVQGYLVSVTAELTGRNITNVVLTPANVQPQAVVVAFDAYGTSRLASVTESNIFRQLGIVLDGKLLSAPTIMEPITGGNMRITGVFSNDDVVNFPLILEYPFPVQTKILEVKSF